MTARRLTAWLLLAASGAAQNCARPHLGATSGPVHQNAREKAFDALEMHLDQEAGDTPAALLTISHSPKFFSNGIDPDGQYTKKLGLPPPKDAEEAAELSVIGLASFTRPP